MNITSVITGGVIALLFGIVIPFTLFFRFTLMMIVIISLIITISIYCFESNNKNLFSLQYFYLFVCISLFVSLGIARSHSSIEERETYRNIDSTVSQELILKVDTVPEKKDYNQVFIASFIIDPKKRILVRAPFYPKLHYNDVIQFNSKIILPESFTTESGRIFNYPLFLEKDRVFGLARPYSVIVLDYNHYNNCTQIFFLNLCSEKVKEFLFFIKAYFEDSLHMHVGEPVSGLLAGITVGTEDGLSSDMQETFRKAGIIHIVVLSGYNVALVSNSFARLFGILGGRIFGMICGLLGIVLFAIMTGGSSTIVRASIMTAIAVVGRLIYKPHHSGRVLLITAGLMVFQNPYILLYDPSFQLSFLATIGIMYVAPGMFALGNICVSCFVKTHKILKMKVSWFIELIVGTLSTQLTVIPIIVWMSGGISLVSPLANILIVPMVAPLMLLTALTVISSWLSTGLTFFFGGFARLGGSLIIFLAEWSILFPWSYLNLSSQWQIALSLVAISMMATFIFLGSRSGKNSGDIFTERKI